jgi:hypothetical protein
MEDFAGRDRRHPSNNSLSIVVDVGVTCLVSLGEKTAKLLFLAHNVPSTIAARVIFHEHTRRATALEHAAISERSSADIDRLPIEHSRRSDRGSRRRRYLVQSLGQAERRESARGRISLRYRANTV